MADKVKVNLTLSAEQIQEKLDRLYAMKEREREIKSGLTQQDIDIRGACEESLSVFLQHAWQYIDPAPYIHNWHIDAISEHLMAVSKGELRHLLINQPPRTAKSALCSVAFVPWIWTQQDIGPISGPQTTALYASYAQTLSLRDSLKARRLVQSPWYQKLWGSRFQMTGDQNTKSRFENDAGGYRLATSVGSALTGEGGQLIVGDDCHNAVEAESELVRQGVLDWWDTALSTRHNDPKTGSYVVVMQRLHENDLTGHIVSKMNEDWTWLMLPMRYEAARHCVTPIFEDPRTEEGELLWEERMGEKEVRALEVALGPYGCTPKESPVLMSDLSMKPISEVKIGDEVVGFTTDTEKGIARRTLKKSNVVNIFTYMAEVVKITLDSGKIIRCTPDHKWYMGKQAKKRQGKYPDDPIYRPAIIGRKLMRVCDPSLPVLTPEQERMGGWLGGFFDGEGSVSLCNKRGWVRPNGKDYKSSAQISFHHSLTGRGQNSLPLFQNFLHIAHPVKWKQRLIDGAYTSKFIISQEKVVSIEPDGIETVYALETTTGNYVVWGLASSNSSGQLQQSPLPKGGGIIRREDWKLWGNSDDINDPYYKRFPMMEFVVASLDPAYTEKQENDYSALVVLGVFRDKNNMLRVMLMGAWQERLAINDLVNKTAKTCERFRIDKLLIENKASGISVGQEIKRLHGNAQWSTQLVDPRGQDKVARTHAIQHIWGEGIVYAPDREYADLVINQMASFPRAKHDDLHDAVIQGITYLRNNGLILRKEERDAIMARELAPQGPDEPLYDV